MKHEHYSELDQDTSGKLQVATRLSADFVLRTLSLLLTRDNVDLMLSVVLLTIQAGNLAHIDRDREESERYSEYEAVTPDSMQRPVSVLYVSTALGIPYETARRYVGRLLKMGECVRVPRGYLTPKQSQLTQGGFHRHHSNAANLRLLYRRLKAAGFPFDDDAGGPGFAVESEPRGTGKVRVAVRLTADYFLRTMGVISHLERGGFMLAIVMLTIHAGNVAHIDQDSAESEKYAEFETPPPLPQQRPVSVLYVSTALGIPYETARRHVGLLLQSGDCLRVGRGLVTPRQTTVSAGQLERRRRNAANLRRLFRRLRAAGFPLEE